MGKERSITVYLPDEKILSVAKASNKVRQSKTKWIESAIDEKLKNEKSLSV